MLYALRTTGRDGSKARHYGVKAKSKRAGDRRAARETSDERRETRDERRETRDERRETRDERRETSDERRETRDERRETRDERRETRDERQRNERRREAKYRSTVEFASNGSNVRTNDGERHHPFSHSPPSKPPQKKRRPSREPSKEPSKRKREARRRKEGMGRSFWNRPFILHAPPPFLLLCLPRHEPPLYKRSFLQLPMPMQISYVPRVAAESQLSCTSASRLSHSHPHISYTPLILLSITELDTFPALKEFLPTLEVAVSAVASPIDVYKSSLSRGCTAE